KMDGSSSRDGDIRSFFIHDNNPLPISFVSSSSVMISRGDSVSSMNDGDRSEKERHFLLACERGDIGSVRKTLACAREERLDINCVDPLGRSALLIAVENENIEMIEVLLEENVETGDAILYAIEEENVEAVEILISYLEKIDKFNPETQGVEINEHSAFTPDLTPIILAAHKDNFECYKLLYDKKATIPRPHDINCDCEDCEIAREDDSLRLSRARLNAYRALTSPSHICLHASDPILYAFELSWELRRLSYIENEFRQEYQELSQKCQKFSVQMLDQVRGAKELEIILNYNTKTWEEVTTKSHHLSETLARLKLAVKMRQKKFVSHPNCQQLLADIWYEGLPIRNSNIFIKLLVIISVALAFPLWSIIYLIAPKSRISAFVRKPFVKFLSHSGSYCFFLFLLILASQRLDSLENIFGKYSGENPERKERRGPEPTIIELAILSWVFGLIWVEIKQLWDEGVVDYCHNLWNILDFITNSLYLSTFALRTVAYFMVKNDAKRGFTMQLPRSKWDAWDPTLISECLFATANIFSSLKLVHIFTINPHLGPLKISLGRMVIDILKFFLVYCLVLFAFACGLNQLMWYYSSIRIKECDEYRTTTRNILSLDEIDLITRKKGESCNEKFTSCASIYHTVETLFWAIFGLVDLEHFHLFDDHYVSEWTGKTIFGSYCCCSIIVLLNMLIAMMSNSYSYICNQADVEWKFARSKLWMEYFDDTATLAPPFNMVPSPKSFYYTLKWICDRFCNCSKTIQAGKQKSIRTQKIIKVVNERENNYRFVTRNLTKRFIAQTQRLKQQNMGVNEDDISEIKQDISAFRFELLGILRTAGFHTGHNDMNQKTYSRNKKRTAMAERRMKKGLTEFNIPVPESFQASRRQSVATGESKNGTPLRLPQLNWRKLKKKVSFKYPSSSSTQSPLTTSSPSSLKTPFDKSAYLKSKSFDAGNSFCVGPEIPYRKTTQIGHDRPRLQKQVARRPSEDTMLEIDADVDALL
ncbi:trp-2, partial [Pristionchus pacificus]